MRSDTSRSFCKSIRLLFFFFLAAIIISPLQAADWLDNFSDGSITDDDPVTWSVNPLGVFPGNYSPTANSLAFVTINEDIEDELMVAWVPSEDFSTTGSVRTRATILTDPPEVFSGEGNVGPILFFDDIALTGYFGVLDAGGGLFLYSGTGGGDSTELARADLEFNATEEVFVQLDHDGEFVSLSAWPIGDPQPDPQLVVEHTAHTSGTAGLIFAEDNFKDAALFHMARASSHRIVDGQDIVGDFNLDEVLNGSDIDALMNEVAAGSNDSVFDLTNDGLVDDDDRDEWLAIAGPQNGFAGAFLVGDANLDGMVDSTDLNEVGIQWLTDNNNWTKGNFTGSLTNVADLNALGINWQQSVSLAAAPGSVPEPTAQVLLLFAAASSMCRRRRRA